jgi:acyl-CoA thioester hydrolase
MYADFRHRMPLRVRWAEVDKQGVVFNAHYLLYCDVCVTEYWRAAGVRYPDDFAAHGSDLFVRKSTVEYFSAAYYDDELEICGRIARLGSSSIRFVVEIYRRRQYEAVLVTAELIYVHADPVSRTALTIPDAMRARIRAFETTPPEDGPDANRTR